MSEYKTNDQGIIVSLGKFEGEPLWVPYFWEQYLEGGSDRDYYEDNDLLISKFIVTDEDRQRFPELKDIIIVELWEDSNGFVHSNKR